MLRVVMEGRKAQGRPRLTWLHRYPSERKEHISARRPCFENRQDWRTLISRSPDRSSVEDPTWSRVREQLQTVDLKLSPVQCRYYFVDRSVTSRVTCST